MKHASLCLALVAALLDSGCLMGVRAARRAARAHPSDPVFATLDTNHDGVVDSAELAAAPVSLQALDRNHDGRITDDELRSR